MIDLMKRAVAALEALGLLEYPEGLNFSVVDHGGRRIKGLPLPSYDKTWLAEGGQINGHPVLPDGESDLTLGWMLGRVRKAWDDPLIDVSPALKVDGYPQRWVCRVSTDSFNSRLFRSDVEMGALVAALEARVVDSKGGGK